MKAIVVSAAPFVDESALVWMDIPVQIFQTRQCVAVHIDAQGQTHQVWKDILWYGSLCMLSLDQKLEDHMH